MFTRPTTPELLEAVTSLLRELRDHPENAPAAPLEVAVEVAGVIERRIEHEPRSLVAGNPARVFQKYEQEYIDAEIERVRAENKRRRELAEARGEEVLWGAPAGVGIHR